MSSLYYIGQDDILERVKSLKTDKILLVVDENVLNLYSSFIEKLKNLGKEVSIYKALGNESLKSFSHLEECLEFFLDAGAHRKTHLIAIGGGATSDFAGLVAALLLRGIEWSVIPTTLLSMVDAAIGGKTAINSRYGKNLVGAFHLPESIWVDTKFLETLPDEHVLSGRGELLKYALVSSNINRQVRDPKMTFNALVSACAQFKKMLVERDLREEGERKILNLGHTFGHAIEKMYPVPHGVAVYFGMKLIFEIYEEAKNIDALNEITTILKWDFGPVPWKESGLDCEQLMSFVLKDKKMASTGFLEMIRLKGAGTPYIDKVDVKKLNELLLKRKESLNAL